MCARSEHGYACGLCVRATTVRVCAFEGGHLAANEMWKCKPLLVWPCPWSPYLISGCCLPFCSLVQIVMLTCFVARQKKKKKHLEVKNNCVEMRFML